MGLASSIGASPLVSLLLSSRLLLSSPHIFFLIRESIDL